MSSHAASRSSNTSSGRFSGAAYDAVLPLVGRVFLCAIFLISGFGKLGAPAATIGYIASSGLPLPELGLAIAVLTEIGGGLALLAGYRTRLAAGCLAVFCLAAAVFFHNNVGDQNQFIHFLKNVAMCGGLLQVMAFGAGRFSIDARQR